MTDDRPDRDEAPAKGDTDPLWDAASDGVDEELQSLERRLRPHAHRPRAFRWPQDAVQERGAVQGSGVAQDGGVEQDEPSAHGDSAESRSWAASGEDSHGRRSVFSSGTNPWLRYGTALLGAAAVVLLLIDALQSFGDQQASPSIDENGPYVVEALSGVVRVERAGALRSGERLGLGPGDRLVCDDETRAQLQVRHAGRVRLEANSVLRLETGPTDGPEGWRLFLEQGQLTASIFAAPRLFQVGTPSGIAVDLGCEYTATVDDDGRTMLSVRGGQVSFETPGRKVFVPSGARVIAWPGHGPGTPVWEDAPVSLRRAVDRLDEAAVQGRLGTLSPELTQTLEALLAARAPRHSLSLWHLLAYPQLQVRNAVRDELWQRSPPPEGVSLKSVAAADAAALALWRTRLERDW
jgi:hypothetical protein